MIIDMEESDSDSSSELDEMAQHMIMCMNIYDYWYSYVDKVPCHTSILSGAEYVQELLNGHPDRIYNSFRMDKHVFQRLCCTLQSLNLLHDDRHVGVQEAVAIFLYIVSHSERMRIAAERFQRSKDTIHRQFKRVLTALCKLSPHIIRPPSQGEIPSEILNNPKYYPYFEVRKKLLLGMKVIYFVVYLSNFSYIFHGRNVLVQLMGHMLLHGLRLKNKLHIVVGRSLLPKMSCVHAILI